MQRNIAMNFAGHVDWILLCKRGKFGEKKYWNSRDIEFLLGDYFFIGAPVVIWVQCVPHKYQEPEQDVQENKLTPLSL